MALSNTALPDLVSDFRSRGRQLLDLRDELVEVRARYTSFDGGNTLAETFDAATEGAANAGIARADFVTMVSNIDAVIAAIDAAGRRDAIAKVAY